jgi:eukaryotic-like serine/threonine-protein kinase
MPRDGYKVAPVSGRPALVYNLVTTKESCAEGLRMSEPVRDLDTAGDETKAKSSAPETHAATRVPNGQRASLASLDMVAGRYEVLEEIAQGGMGTVLRANDRTIGREVAIKVLQECYPAGSVIARRFVDEAQISGQLQHPGIPPVHDLGSFPDGRPFLAMKLIKGRTLGSILRDRSDPAADRGRFLAVFEAICQAVAYAHSRRVIHRDLKPSNVMVGAFGEVQVMDWGLAKVLSGVTGLRVAAPADSDRALATQIRSARDSDGSETQAGSVLGTPAYMAPEQAVGAVDQVDERSDVFGLGAILAVILTGEPPFVGNSAEATRVMAARGKVEDCFARLDSSGAEPELIGLCKRCLSPERDDRPANGAAVAAGVAGLRADAEERARRAELDRVRAEGERARAEAESRLHRQRRKSQLVAAAGLLGLLVIAGGAFLAVRAQSEARRSDADRVASLALGRAEQLAAQAEAIDVSDLAEASVASRLWEQAAAAVAQAQEAVARAGSAALAARVRGRAEAMRSESTRARRDATLLGALEAARAADSGTAAGWIDRRTSIRMYRTALSEAGLPADGDAASLAAAVRAERPGLQNALRETLDDWINCLRNPPDPDAARVLEAANFVDPDPFRTEIRAAAAADDKSALIRLAERPGATDLPQSTAVMLGISLSDQDCNPEAIRILRAARARYPSDLRLLSRLSQSIAEASPNDPVALEESLGCAQVAVAAHPDKAFSHYMLGAAFAYYKHDSAAAEPHYRKTLELNPRFTFAMVNLAIRLQSKGDVAGMEYWYRKAIETDPKFVRPRNNLASSLLGRGDVAGALAEYRKVIEILPAYAGGHANLAGALEQGGDLPAALAEYRRAVELAPKDTGLRHRLAAGERLVSLRSRLDDAIAGKSAPGSPEEAMEFANLCSRPFLKRYAAATRLATLAFAGNGKPAEDFTEFRVYNAACWAALSGCGQGTDAPLDPDRRAALRDQALAWLRAELAVRANQACSDKPDDRKTAADRCSWWLEDSDLAGVRPGASGVSLPAAERQTWDEFWAKVRATIAVARTPVTTAAPAAKP